MKKLLRTTTLAVALSIIINAPTQAQTTEERFQDLFITAGYSTAFGAALGAAFLSFTENPSSKLRFVAVGASMGFIGGSIFGTYVVFSPIFGSTQTASDIFLADASTPHLTISPLINEKKFSIQGVKGSWTIAQW